MKKGTNVIERKYTNNKNIENQYIGKKSIAILEKPNNVIHSKAHKLTEVF